MSCLSWKCLPQQQGEHSRHGADDDHDDVEKVILNSTIQEEKVEEVTKKRERERERAKMKEKVNSTSRHSFDYFNVFGFFIT